MVEDEEYHDDFIADREPCFRAHTNIPANDLISALHSLVLLRENIYLRLQVTNLTVVGQFIMGIEHQTLQEYIKTDRAPPTTMFLNAQKT